MGDEDSNITSTIGTMGADLKQSVERVTDPIRPKGRDEDGRDTVFPQVYIEEISIEKPPFDEPGVVQEYVGRGATKEFETLQKIDSVGEDTIQSWINSLEEVIGPIRDSFKLEYTFLMKAVSGRAARTKARAITRAKNPFEVDILEVSDAEVAFDDTTPDTYRVSVTVTK